MRGDPLTVPLTPEPPGGPATSRLPQSAPPGLAVNRGLTALKFVGVVRAPESAGLVAVLSDGDDVYHGRVNEIIEGRYRIVAIGATSIEIEHLQGGGRQTIRLSGS